jgi:hypothetical protein
MRSITHAHGTIVQFHATDFIDITAVFPKSGRALVKIAAA